MPVALTSSIFIDYSADILYIFFNEQENSHLQIYTQFAQAAPATPAHSAAVRRHLIKES